MKMHANKREEIQEILAGDICAAVGLKTVVTGDTICDEDSPIVLESIDFPAPVIQLAIEPKTKADQEKLGMAIAKLATGRSDAAGFDRSGNRPDDSRRHGRAAPRNHRRPHEARVQRRGERRQAAGRLSRNDPQQGGSTTTRTRSRPAAAASTRASSCASSRIRARASSSRTKSPAATFRRNSSRRSKRVSSKRSKAAFWPAIPMVDVKVTVFDGAYHDVDSSEMAFKICGSICVKEACRKAKPVLLEPVMRVEVVVPDEYMGPVNGDLISRRGRLEGTEIRGRHADHQGDGAAVSEMFGYATELRSRTQGRGSFTMHFGQYEEVPRNLAEEIINASTGQSRNQS